MIEKSKNKDMANVETKETKALVEEFFFSGSGVYVPQAVMAESYAQAVEIYERTRVAVSGTI